MRAPAGESRSAPERILLEVHPGTRPDPRPPVRLFVGTEAAQHRAERVFLWSIERVRDPSRRYEVWLLKGLSGFRRRGWTTGFTNYRFAVPDFAGGSGRAVYNDVDQIYLADPGPLFDAALGGHGCLAVAPDDPSVMLLDCARMSSIWTLDGARNSTKPELIRRALAVPGLYGPLAPEWNARDEEYAPGQSKCLHYTALHTQPWRPFPERFVYQAHPHAEPWLRLEAEADAAGYRVFTRERPSAAYGEGGAEPRLEATPVDDLPWRLDEIFRARGERVRIEIACEGTPAPEGERRTPEWWSERIEAVAASHPGVRWEAILRAPAGRVVERVGGPRPDGSPPRVWVLTDDRGGNTTQSVGLAEALGWPYARKSLRPGPLAGLHNRLLGASRAGVARARSDPLEPPWPDLVIAAGRRTAPVALWIREQSRGRTRLVQLGRKGGDAADRFDLVATPAYCRLFPHPHRVETTAPLHALTPDPIAAAAASWKQRLESSPAPRIALLVGGTSGQYWLSHDTARGLAQDVGRFDNAAGGSVFATTSRRLSRAAGDALVAALGSDAWVHRWRPDDRENPYLGFLAVADAIVITGDSESMLAEATALGRPVYVYPLPERPIFRLMRAVREPLVARAQSLPSGPRGTPRPQQGLERFCARLIERGFVRPTRDLERLHQQLYRRGMAKPFGEPFAGASRTPPNDLERVASRVRELMGVL